MTTEESIGQSVSNANLALANVEVALHEFHVAIQYGQIERAKGAQTAAIASLEAHTDAILSVCTALR